MIKDVDTEYSSGHQEIYIKENILKISDMAWEKCIGLIPPIIKGNNQLFDIILTKSWALVNVSYYKYNRDWQKGIQCGYGELFTPGEGLRKGVFANNTFKENGKDTNSIKNTMDDSAFPRRIEMGLSSKNKFMPNSVMLTEGKQDTPISNTK